MGKIVVGVDGSENARRALQWAIDEGRLRSWAVEAVHAWSYPYAGGTEIVPLTIDLSMIESAAREVLDTAVDSTDGSGLPSPVVRTLINGGAARALLDASKDADLLVVGSRGRGGFTGLLLGSVSQSAVHHAPCPVVIVPTDRS